MFGLSPKTMYVICGMAMAILFLVKWTLTPTWAFWTIRFFLRSGSIMESVNITSKMAMLYVMLQLRNAEVSRYGCKSSSMSCSESRLKSHKALPWWVRVTLANQRNMYEIYSWLVIFLQQKWTEITIVVYQNIVYNTARRIASTITAHERPSHN